MDLQITHITQQQRLPAVKRDVTEQEQVLITIHAQQVHQDAAGVQLPHTPHLYPLEYKLVSKLSKSSTNFFVLKNGCVF